jgi:hypothetical protein
MMKAHKVYLPDWESSKNDTEDFLNLVEQRQERTRGSDVILIDKTPEKPDDVVHAVNYVCSTIWYTNQKYPNIAEANAMRLSQLEINKIAPKVPNWDKEDDE